MPPTVVRPNASSSRQTRKTASRSRSRSIEAESGPSHRATNPRSRSREPQSILPTIQSIPARRFSITPTGIRSSRHRASNEDMGIAIHWTHDYDDDFNEFVILWAQKSDPKVYNRPLNNDNMPIYYRIINTFLLLLRFRGEQDRIFFGKDIASIKEAAAQIEFVIDTDIIIKNLLQNILTLFVAVNGFPKASTIDVIIQDKPSDIVLYHGFKYPEAPIIQKLRALKQDEIFIMPIFLSTSVLLEVACRFSGSAKLLLRINVPKTHFDKCPYAYLGTSLVIGNTNSYGEHEILLNLFTELKFIETKQEMIAYRIPQVQGVPLEKTELFTVYIMEFHNISSKTRSELNTELVRLVDDYKPDPKPKGVGK